MLWYECNDWSNIKHRTFTLNINTTPILPELANAHGQPASPSPEVNSRYEDELQDAQDESHPFYSTSTIKMIKFSKIKSPKILIDVMFVNPAQI